MYPTRRAMSADIYIYIPCASKGLSKAGLWKEALICQEALFCKPGSIHGKYPRLFKAFGPLFLAQKTWFYIGCIWCVTHDVATCCPLCSQSLTSLPRIALLQGSCLNGRTPVELRFHAFLWRCRHSFGDPAFFVEQTPRSCTKAAVGPSKRLGFGSSVMWSCWVFLCCPRFLALRPRLFEAFPRLFEAFPRLFEAFPRLFPAFPRVVHALSTVQLVF